MASTKNSAHFRTQIRLARLGRDNSTHFAPQDLETTALKRQAAQTSLNLGGTISVAFSRITQPDARTPAGVLGN